MALQSEQINGRSNPERKGRSPADPSMYPRWAQNMIQRVMRLATRPNQFIIVFTVHPDGRKEMDIMQATRPSEELGK